MNNGFRSPYAILSEELLPWFDVHYVTFKGRIVSRAYLRFRAASDVCIMLNCAYNTGLLDADAECRAIGFVPPIRNDASNHSGKVVSLDRKRAEKKQTVSKPRRGHLRLVERSDG